MIGRVSEEEAAASGVGGERSHYGGSFSRLSSCHPGGGPTPFPCQARS